jgi:hypothetical protein
MEVSSVNLTLPDYVRVARENEAVRAEDAASCIDTSLGTVLLKNRWGRR